MIQLPFFDNHTSQAVKSSQEHLAGNDCGNNDLFPPVQKKNNPDPVTQPDDWFFNYRLEAFSPDTEPLIKATFGNSLKFEEDAFWDFNSYHSHAVGFATNLPTRGVIQYGETNCYDRETSVTESYFYTHLAHLTGLEE